MPFTYYRSGQAAKELGVSPHVLRRLCEAGLVEAELTDSNHWRIPAKELERMKRDGVPQLPAGADPRQTDAVTAKPIAAIEPVDAPEVRQEKNAVVIARNRLERRKLELEEETVNDAFREREAIKTREATAVEQRKRQAAEEEARQRLAAAEAARRRKWEEEHVKDALRWVPPSVIGELRLKVDEEVRTVLRLRSPEDDEDITERLVEAARDKALFPTRRYRIANNAATFLPYGMQDGELGEKAKSLATAALKSMLSTSTDEEMKTVVRRAVEPLIEAAQHQLNVRSELDQLRSWMILKATDEERKRAKAAARQALAALPVGTTVQTMRKAVEKALRPLEAEVEDGHERQRLRQRADELAERAESLLMSELREYEGYEDYTERSDRAKELKPQLEPVLRRAVMRGDLDAGSAAEFVESWVAELEGEAE